MDFRDARLVIGTTNEFCELSTKYNISVCVVFYDRSSRDTYPNNPAI